MSDAYEHNPGDHEDPLPGPTWIVGLLGSVLLAVIMLGLTALYYNAYAEEETAKVVEVDPMELTTLQEQQLAELNGEYRLKEVVEEERKIQAVIIPIDQAMRLTVQEYQD